MINMKKVVIFAVTLIFLVYIVKSGQEIYSLWKKQDLLIQEKQKLLVKENEHKMLLKELSAAQEPGFVEKEARDKLFLAKPGEYRVSLQPEDKEIVNAAGKLLPAWQQWVQRFIY